MGESYVYTICLLNKWDFCNLLFPPPVSANYCMLPFSALSQYSPKRLHFTTNCLFFKKQEGKLLHCFTGTENRARLRIKQLVYPHREQGSSVFQHEQCLIPKRHPIPYGPWSKVVHCIGHAVQVGTHTHNKAAAGHNR